MNSNFSARSNVCSVPIGRSIVFLWMLLLAQFILAQTGTSAGADVYVSPDKRQIAKVFSVAKEGGQPESKIEIYAAGNGTLLSACNFFSPDGQHGYGVTRSQWTDDSGFFVFTMSNSGGHSPMFAPVVFWSRKDKIFYELPQYTVSQVFNLRGDTIQLSTWPGMQPATVRLHHLRRGDAVAVKPRE